MGNRSEQKSTAQTQEKYWQRAQRLTLYLLSVWFLATFLTVFFARELSAVTFFGWPFSFYMAAQGTILVYAAIVGVYAWRMRRLDLMRKGDCADE